MQKQRAKHIIIFIGKMLLLMLSFSVSANAQVPQKINYQGYLTDSVTGIPVNDDVEMTFSIYDVANDGTALWTETQTVAVSDGRYSIQLGENTPIDLLEPKPYWLGVQIGTEPELTPREELTSALYALFAKYLEGITIKDGKVGIGTDDPQEMLDVHGNAHIHGMLRVGPNSLMLGKLRESSGKHCIYTTTDDAISFTNPENGIATDLTDIGNINAQGNIISEGNITASGKISASAVATTGLDVNGKIKGKQICIGNACRTTWPDPCSCLPVCENGQTMKYSGITEKWECDGEPIPLPTMKPLYQLCIGYSDECNGTANNYYHWSNHIDSPSPNALAQFGSDTCKRRLGYVLETQISGTKPLYKIYRSHDANDIDIKDDHMSTDNLNEINTYGGTSEGIMGYVYITQVPGTIPLYRKYRKYQYNTGQVGPYEHTDHITTTDPNEGNGWVNEHVLGYIVGPASSSCR